MSISFSSAIGRFGPSRMYIMTGDTEGTSEKGGHGKGTTQWKRETEGGAVALRGAWTFMRVLGPVEREIRGREKKCLERCLGTGE